ncbi:MAG: radical SAM protein, partial [Flavobacteriales bacterium]|nr:radical SAM protein [Flavobacteriales bacterium]
LVQLGISGINISLDTLDSRQFVQLTKRDLLQPTLDAIDAVLEKGIPCKINTVVQEGINDDSIVEMTAWARDKNVEIRFIEFMPFNGKQSNNGFISGAFIENKIKSEFNVKSLPMKFGDTASKFQHESGSKVGVIHAFTRNFCGSCNRIRLDAKGNFRNCLYGASHQGLKEIIRSGAEDSQIQEFIRQQIASKPKNGFSAENEVPHSFESMSIVGG